MKADLHVHSTASDGTLTPTQLVDEAVERGVSVLAIADHDSVEGIDEALRAATRHPGLTLIPALELSASANQHDVHLLGYFVDHRDPVLGMRLEQLREARYDRAVRMLRLLAESGFSLDIDSVLELSDGGAVGRSHIARALVQAGHARDLSDAFARLIGRARPFYLSKNAPTPAQAIETIRAAGGLPVVAHPGVSELGGLVESFVEDGLGGIEAYHVDHTEEQREFFSAMARRHGLLVTGGSDFHGPQAPNPALGSARVPAGAVEALLAWGERRA